VLDYDLSKPSQVQSACEVLDGISKSVDIEEATGFDPSGSSGATLIDDDTNPMAQNEARSEGQSTFGWSSGTEDTSLSHGMSALDLEGLEFKTSKQPIEDDTAGALADANIAQLEGLDLAGKEAALMEAFSGLKPFDIKWTLKKYKGDAGKAIEDLLNQTFLEENGGQYRGIEGFSETGILAKPKKKNRRNRSTLSDERPGSSASDPLIDISSKWDNARQDIELVSTLTGTPMQQVSSLYHKYGGQVSSTINAIVDVHQALELDEDAASYLHASLLIKDFPTIPITKLVTIVQLCDTTGASSRELCKALTIRPSNNRSGPSIQLEFRLPPPDLSDGFAESKPRSKGHNAVYLNGQAPVQVSSNINDGKNYIALRNGAFDQASAAYRRGKSDPLMGGAAAYYSSLGHDYDAKAKTASAAAADVLAARQSTSSELDLHGIGVVDAVRIAREKVTHWWARLDDGMNGHGGYKIVTGKGTHSEGGVARIRNSVGRMLIREGWKIEIGSGSILVTGVVSKKKAF